MKKLCMVLLTGFAAFTLWAAPSREAAPKKISFLVNNSQVLDPYEAMFAKYKQQTGVEVEIGTMDATNEQYILTRFATRDYPDAFYFDPGTKQYTKFRTEELYEWTNDPLFNNVTPATKQFQTLDGRIYGVPWGGTSAYGVYYNKDVFAKVGVQEPKNWQDFINILNKIKAAGIIPIYEAHTEWPIQVFFLAAWPTYIDPAIGAAGVVKLNQNELDLADIPEVQRVFRLYLDLADGGYFQANYQAGTYNEQCEALGSGKAAMMFSIGNSLSQLAGMFGQAEVDRNIGFFPIPGAADQGTACLSPPNQILVPARAANVQGAVDLIHFMLQPENLLAYYRVIGSIPVYQGVNVELRGCMQTIRDLDASGKSMINVQNRLSSSFTDLVKVLQTMMIDRDTAAAARTLSANYKQTGKARALPGF